ncbi:hypothetical protein [Methylobacterium sp. J-076]|uniref:hypothetical protein n=1 Tax=Methylobacterium sp. J-076 TaxID=2836655 RepID=UPI001FB9F3D2|nr:hypothetical protein [Methylobacterium sp. J-076]MCJ2011372.1 hypothetical protein [Methylobacterium sp. J-076]
MLAFITARVPSPVQEVADRDPGIFTLAFALLRTVRRTSAEAFTLHCNLMAKAGGPNPF